MVMQPHHRGKRVDPGSDKYKVLDKLRSAGKNGVTSIELKKLLHKDGTGHIRTLLNEGYGIKKVKTHTTYYLEKDIQLDKKQAPDRKTYSLNELTLGGPVKVVKPARNKSFYGGTTRHKPKIGKLVGKD